ncbi:hypothetical protein CYMTET_43453, partial [Cymbomonas tetramitiformis]
AGMAALLDSAVVGQALHDLHLVLLALQPSDQDAMISIGTGRQGGRAAKKRKKGGAFGMEEDTESGEGQQAEDALAAPVEASLDLASAALEVLEALVVVGGPQLPEGRRRQLDGALLEVALQVVPRRSMTTGHRAASEPLRLRVVEVLVAVVLAPRLCSSPALSSVLHLLRCARNQGGVEMGAACTRAIMALEVQLHPRAVLMPAPPPPDVLDRAATGGLGGTDGWAEADELLQLHAQQQFRIPKGPVAANVEHVHGAEVQKKLQKQPLLALGGQSGGGANPMETGIESSSVSASRGAAVGSPDMTSRAHAIMNVSASIPQLFQPKEDVIPAPRPQAQSSVERGKPMPTGDGTGGSSAVPVAEAGASDVPANGGDLFDDDELPDIVVGADSDDDDEDEDDDEEDDEDDDEDE